MSKSIFSQFGTNTDLERSGRWVEFYGDDCLYKFLLARAGGANETYQRNLLQATKPYRKGSVDIEDLPPATQRQIMIKVYAETVIRDWSGIVFEDDGPEIPFNVDNAKRLLADAPQLFDFIAAEANNFRNYMEAKRSTDAKN